MSGLRRIKGYQSGRPVQSLLQKVAKEPMTPHFRAPNEYAFAAWLDALAVPWKYESLEPAIARAIRYQPDFWLPDSLAWLEIKPGFHRPTPGEERVARLLAEATGRPVYLAAGWPYSGEKLRLWVYPWPLTGELAAFGGSALTLLAALLGRSLSDVGGACLRVEGRHREFVNLWMEAKKGN